MSNEVIHAMAVNQQGVLLIVFISSSESPRIPHLCSAFEFCLSPAYTPSSLSLLLPPLQRLIQDVAKEDAQHTELRPQPGPASQQQLHEENITKS